MKGGLVALLAIGLVVLLLVVAGVLHFTKSEDEVNVRIDTGKIEQAAEKTAEKGKESLEEAGEALQRLGKDLQEESDDEENPETPETEN